MLLRVQVISGGGYESTAHIKVATSSTNPSSVSRGVVMKGAKLETHTNKLPHTQTDI